MNPDTPKPAEEKTPRCIYLVAGKPCDKPATHYLVRHGKPRHFYCDTHADFVRSATRGLIIEPLNEKH